MPGFNRGYNEFGVANSSSKIETLEPTQPNTMKRKKDIFNPAFKDLKQRIESYSRVTEKPDQVPSAPVAAEMEEQTHFEEAMADVAPLADEKIRIARNRGFNPRPAHPAPNDEREGLTRLRHLVEGSVEMDITFSDEYMEGAVKGLHHRALKRLKKGHRAVKV